MRALVVVLAMVTGVPAWADGGLVRLTTREELRGFEPVGRVDTPSGFCTGVLIAADLVLTAGHCAITPDNRPVDAGAITFRAGLADGIALVEAKVARTLVHPDFRVIEPSPAEMILVDVALLQLATPIATSVISPYAVASPGNGDEVSVVSYASGREEALSWQRACNVLGRQGGLIAVDCDVTYGSSGAPVLDRSHYRAKVVSIISAGYNDNGMRVTWGMELPGIVAELKAGLRAGRFTSEAAMTDAVADAPRVVGKRITVGGDTGDTGARFVKP